MKHEELIKRLEVSCLGLDAVDPLRLLVDDVVAALRGPEQEPVMWPCLIDSADFSANTITLVMQCEDYKVSAGTHWLSTTPSQREWVGLTDEEIKEFDTWHDNREEEVGWCNPSEIVAYIEAKLKEKNNG